MLLLPLLLPTVLRAAEPEGRVNGADVQEIRAVIHRQIDAVRTEAKGACAVHRPSAVRFLDLILMGAEVVQRVQLTDRAGAIWVAYYTMFKRDGRWQADGCRLVQSSRGLAV
jgi:lipase chaperone LimK